MRTDPSIQLPTHLVFYNQSNHVAFGCYIDFQYIQKDQGEVHQDFDMFFG